MAESYLFPVFQLIILSLFSTAFSANSSSSSSCPIDFGYVRSYPWDSSICQQSVQSDCCQTIHNLFGMGLAQHLKDTSAFYLPSLQSSSSCLSAFQAELSAMSITQQFASCLNDTNEFVVSPSNCAGISNLSDWDRRVDPSSANQLRLSCNVDLTGLTRCSSCLDAGLAVNSKLVSLSPNSSSKCFYYTVLYAAAIVNEFGPEDIRTATCILGIPLSSSPAKKKSNHSKAIYASLGAFLGVLIFVAGILVYKRWDKKKRQNAFQREYVRSIQARVLPNMGSKWFRIAELDHATDGFSQRNFIGRGAFGVVYKGTLSDGTLVAIKQMIDTDTKGDEEFVNEAEIISKIRHRNLLPLRGFCVTSDLIKGHQRYLVYDFMSNGSLDDHLFNPSRRNELSWPQRKNIIIDVAKGLAYLHYGIKPAIFHRDIKATNILLDSEMKARVADFGLAKESKEGQSHLTTRVAGTYGYLAPEYALYGQLTEKSDVYSFGIIVLEIMSGRKVLEISNTNQNMVLITDWAWELVKSGKVEEIFDSLMSSGEEPKGVMERFVRVGILCAHVMVALRPTISDALKMLEGDIDIPILPDRPLPLGHESFRSSFDQYSSMQSSQYSIATSNVINIT